MSVWRPLKSFSTGFRRKSNESSEEEWVYEQKMDQVCELLEELALDAVISALKKIIDRNDHFQRLQTKKDYMQDLPF